MSLCANVLRRGGVYWWRKKVVCGRPPVRRMIALSLTVREPARARTMATLLNARLLGLGDMMVTGRVSLDQARTILADMIRDEIKLRDDSAFRALTGPRRLDLDPGEDHRESLIRDERAIAGAYGLVAKYGEDLKVDDALEAELGAAGFDEDSIYRIVDWLKVALPRLVSAGAGELGPTVEELRDLLRQYGVDPDSASIDYFWRQFLTVRAKILADTDRRYGRDLTGLDDLYNQIADGLRDAPRPVSQAAPPAAPAAAAPAPVAAARSVATPSAPAPVTSPEQHPFMIWGERYLADAELSAKENDDSFASRHRRSLFRLFAQLLIEKSVFDLADLRQSHFEDLKTLFRELPKSYGKSGRDQTLAELRARGLQVAAAQRGIVGKTLNKHLSSLNLLLQYMRKKRVDIDATLAPNQERSPQRKRARGKHVSLDDDDLKALFDLPCFTGCAGWRKTILSFTPGPSIFHRALYFAPIMLHYTGARRDEICGLGVDDVHCDAAIPYIEVRASGIRRIKNDHSERKIPIHPEVLRLGFAKYVQEIKKLGYVRLFPDLYSPTTSSPLGDRLYDEFIRGLKLAVPEAGRRKKVLHSFRITVGATLKAEKVPSEVRGDILGHGGGSVTEEIYVDDTLLTAKLAQLMMLKNVTAHLPDHPPKEKMNLLPWVRAKETAPFSQPNRSKKARVKG
jgi:integrase